MEAREKRWDTRNLLGWPLDRWVQPFEAGRHDEFPMDIPPHPPRIGYLMVRSEDFEDILVRRLIEQRPSMEVCPGREGVLGAAPCHERSLSRAQRRWPNGPMNSVT